MSEIKYLLSAINRKKLNMRLMVSILVIGLVIGTLPFLRSNADAEEAAGVSYEQITYTDGGGEQQGIDVYKPGNGGNRPGIIFVHGGGWRVGSKSQYEHLGRVAAARGYTAYAIDYRLGSAGTYYQYEDVRLAVQRIMDTAQEHGTDSQRIGILGDSAGGSLAMRVAASGDTGLAAAIGWSAPVNAYTAIFNSYQSFAIGLDHSTCIPTDINALESIPASEGGEYTGEGSPATESEILNVLNKSGLTSSTDGSSVGISDLTDLASQVAGAVTSGGTSGLGQAAQQLVDTGARALNVPTDTRVGRTVNDAGVLAQNLDNNSSTPSIYDPKSDTASEEVKAEAAKSPLAAFATHTADIPLPAEAQRAILALTDTMGCQNDFRVLSPALNFSRNTPPTFLVNAETEFLVHPGQAVEYSNNLRAAGIDSEFLILPGSNHLGYDERAVEPTFAFLDRYLRP